MVFYCFLTISEKKLRIDLEKMQKYVFLLTCEKIQLKNIHNSQPKNYFSLEIQS